LDIPYLETRKYVVNLVVKLRAVSIPENLIDLVQETREVIIETTVTLTSINGLMGVNSPLMNWL
jgi:hypothetical protein